MKVFISFSTQDAPRAEALFAEVEGAGADVFKWGRSEVIGKPSWPQILEWINQSDVFVVLLSGHALASNPVQDEIDQAAYSYSKRRKPGLIVAAILEAGVEPPAIIERFARVGFTDFEQGIARLFGQLGLRRGRRAAPAAGRPGLSTLADLGDIYRTYKAAHPDPLPANVFSKQAERIITNYDALKPKDVAPDERKGDLDSILGELSLTSWTLPRTSSPLVSPSAAPRRIKGKLPSWMTWEDLIHATPASVPKSSGWSGFDAPANLIVAPVLSGVEVSGEFRLSWTKPLFSTGFVLERSGPVDEHFHQPTSIYEGPDDEYTVGVSGSYLCYFRVKAIGVLLGVSEESRWSNVVRWKD